MGKWLDLGMNDELLTVGKELGGHKTKKDFLETAATFYVWALKRTHGTKDVEGGFEVIAMKCVDGCGGTRIRTPDLSTLERK